MPMTDQESSPSGQFSSLIYRRVRADGGRKERRDPADDPQACSRCGVYIGAFSGDYCESCEWEIGVKPPMRRCEDCGREYPEEQMRGIDVSGPEEYYPEFVYLCRGCSDAE